MAIGHVIENNPLRLCDGAELCLRTIDLSPEQEAIVRRCISRYSIPSTFCELLTWITVRVSNAFYALIGKQTEWKAAEEVVKNDAPRKAPAAIENMQRNLPGNITHEPAFRRMFADVIADRDLKLLNLCLRAQDNRAFASDPLRQRLQELDFEHILMRFTNLVNEQAGSRRHS